MSDQPSGFPPPPPPAGQFQPPPGIYQPPGTPPPVVPTSIGPAAGTAGILSQFTGSAGWGVLVGLACIIVPFVFGRVFFFLPIIGLILGVQAIRQRKLIGGIVAIVVNVIGGIITLIALFG